MLQHMLSQYMGLFSGRMKNERGAVATEYAILIFFMVILLVAGVVAFGGDVADWFSGLVGDVQGSG